MKTKLLLWCAAGWLVALTGAQAATLYVDAASTNAVPPFANWTTAAANIQDAVDAADPGDEIVVTNGVYQTGDRSGNGANNRVAVTKPVTVRSVNGPWVTSIVGSGPIGPTAVRCVYLTNGAVLAGFTLTNGATQSFGHSGESGGGVSCEGPGAVVSNCVFMGNAAYFYGGGAYRGTLNNCTFIGNLSGNGGAVSGGSVSPATLNNCILMGNTALYDGGGARASFLNNCILTGNSAQTGGGALLCTLNNCTLTGNSSLWEGGGVATATLNNCIVYYNRARNGEANYNAGSIINYSCTTPLPDSGTGNLAEEPLLAGASHLSPGSPCIGRGNAIYASGTDLDGEPWVNPPSMGCDEYRSGSATGALSVAVVAAHTNVAVAFAVDFQALIGGRVSASRWDFGDGVVVSNRPWASHSWTTPGDYVVELRVYNESEPAGVAATITVHVVHEEHYVALDNASPVPPYTSWATAATNIQAALDAVAVPGAVVWVSNGVYQTGARAVHGMSNRVAVTQPVTVRSVNGPDVTSIVGSGSNGPTAVRCVYLTNGAVLSGFTLTNGATQTSGDVWTNQSGGGVWCESASAVVNDCTLTGNSAAQSGGGAFCGTLGYCTLTSNSAAQYGGGAFYTTLRRCTLKGNFGNYGGGASYCIVNDCALTGNKGTSVGGGAHSSTLNHCTLTGNTVATFGGGASGGTLNHCSLTDNSTAFAGGGVAGGTLNNCTLSGNSSGNRGGGVYTGTLNNCIIYYNAAPNGPNYYTGSTFNYSCTTPAPTNGVGNITDAPLFVDTNSWSNLRLQSNSPSINAGHNASVASGTDLDGRPRLVGGVVDMGAYEYQGLGIGEFIGWLRQSGLPTDGSADDVDTDHDHHNNWQEWVAGTNPTNARSVLWLASPVLTPTNVTLIWASVTNRTYTLEQATNLGGPPAFSVLRSNLLGLPGTTSWTDTNAPVSSPRFYQLRVSP